MQPLHSCQLYTFVDTGYLAGRTPEAVARNLCDGGADLIQLRAKGSTLDEVRKMALDILPIVEAHGVGLVINDYPALAAELGAPLCHLGQEDFYQGGFSNVQGLLRGLPQAKQGVQLRIGLSTHQPEQAERAVASGASYIAIGPVFPTATKPAVKPVTLEYVRWAAAHVKVPWFAIGGITIENLDAVLEAGASRVCVVSAILTAADIAKACHQFKERLVSALRNG